MKTLSISTRVTVPLLCGLAMLSLVAPARAQITTNWWTYNGNQGGSPGSNWNVTGSTAYWKLNGAGTAAVPAAGITNATATNYNFYSLTNNGVQLGNGTATALIRNPYSASTPTLVTFPGDTLILQTNVQLRFKNLGGTGTFSTVNATVNYATPTNNFPGNYGVPGIILNGGCVNNGTSGTAFVIQGSIYANPGSQSYLNPADSFNAASAARGLIFQATLTGSGTIALLNGASYTTAGTPTPFTASNNNFTGTWIVKSGWLQGAGHATADGYNSLGTNTAAVFDIDPLWAPPTGTNVTQGFSNNPAGSAGNAYFYNGPAVLDMGTNLCNSGAAVYLTNGGTLFLHGNVVFSNVWVEGTKIPPGTYTYATLAATYTTALGYQNNFAPAGTPFASPFGTLTIQGYGSAAIPPEIAPQPVSDILYPNRTAMFTVLASGSPTLAYLWYSNGVALTDGGGVLGSATPGLSISGVSAADDASYYVVVTNSFGSATSSVVTLAVVTPVEPYEAAVSNLNPVAYYQFDETTNPALGNVPAFDYAGGFTGVYGTDVQNGYDNIAGPTPSAGFPGFAATNLAIQLANTTGNFISAPAWNLNANTVTMIAWLNPAGVENPSTGVIFCRGTDTVAGLDYLGTLNEISGTYDLGYTWNNDPETYSWDSGLVAPSGQWSMVSLVVTPTQATIYLMNANGLTSSTHVYPHIVQAFDTNNTTLIGEDSADGGNGTRSFLGMIDEVAVFNTALTGDQLAGLFYVATGVSSYAPVIGVEPVASTNVYVGQTFQLSVGAYGTEPLSYQWAAGPGTIYTPLSDVNGIVGSATATLTIQNVTMAEALNYVCIVSNTATPTGVESTPATVTVQAVGSPIFNITMSEQEAAGDDWDIGTPWSDGNSASVSAISEPGSIYEVLPGARLRTPVAITYATFPGQTLLLDGTGFVNNPAAGTTQGEIRLKGSNPLIGLCTVTFPLLVMNGGQMDLGDDGVAEVNGVINVLSNAIFYSDSGDDRGYLLNAQFMGTNSITFYGDAAAASPASYTNDMDIAGNSNTFSGPWFVEYGMLLGSGSDSLGTNNITVSSSASFQTLYDMNNSNALLSLSGKMFLTQTDTFYSVFLGTAPLPVGTYSAAYLCSNYPAYFPSNWIAHLGAATPTNAQGQISVVYTPGPAVLQQPQSLTLYPTQTATFTVIAGGTPPLGYRWFSNNFLLTDNGNLSGSRTTTLTISNIVAADAASYTVVVTNALTGVTSQVATLTVLPTFPPMNIQLTIQESTTGNQDWNTTGVWNDGQGGLPASLSALEFPGSTYEIIPGTLMRTPVAAISYTNFPGVQLTVDGNGVWVDLPDSTSPVGEVRLKQGESGEVNYFPLLIMAGGQLDNGDAGSVAEIAGAMDIVSNTPIYADDAGSTPDRPWQIDAYLFGNGSIQYIDSDTSFSGYLNITCPTNSFTGTWDVVQGPLLGSGLNSLGTNSITVETAGALETLYDMYSPYATLTLNGAMYLHQNDTFQAVTVNGTQLAAGPWTFAALNSNFPANFPATWNDVANSPFTTASGNITVLGAAPPPVTLLLGHSGNSLTLTWSQGTLLQATNLLGPWATNATATSPYIINPTNQQEFFKILTYP